MHNLTIVANLFVALPNSSRRIAEVAFDGGTGAVLGLYFKHKLFPTEKRLVQPGPFAPTSFVANGRRWGMLICYEGLYAELMHDWRQIDGLADAGAEVILWSIGGHLPDRIVGRAIAKRAGLPVLASEDRAAAVAIGADASPHAANASLVLVIANYTGHASVDVFEV